MATYIRNKYLTALLALCFFLPVCIGCSSSDDDPDIPNPPVEEVENKIVIYEANPGLFGNNSAFNAIANRLDDIQAMGVNVIWLMPVYEQGVKDAFGSPYCVKDYKKTNAAYGTLAELKSLVTKAHGKGMRIILDWVANHTSWDNAWIANKSWYTQDAGGNIISPPGMGWNDVADLDYGNKDMRAAMLDAMKYWISEADVDGYRYDYVEGVPSDFWQEAIKELQALKGDNLLMLAESGNAKYFADGFHLVYAWDFAYKLQDVYAGKSTIAALYATHNQEYQGVPEGKQRMRYTTNHDMAYEKSPIQVFGGEQGALSAYVIAATLAGSPMIYSSQEIGYAQPLSFFDHKPLDWTSNATYKTSYKNIMTVYHASEALRKGTLKTYDTGKVASFYRESQKEGVLVMVNTTNSVETIKVPIEYAHEEARNLMDNSTATLPTTLTLEPYQFFIFKMK